MIKNESEISLPRKQTQAVAKTGKKDSKKVQRKTPHSKKHRGCKISYEMLIKKTKSLMTRETNSYEH